MTGSATGGATPAGDAVVLENLSHAFETGPPVLRDAHLRIRAGHRVALLGANGSGKSTLLRCLSGALRPRRGTVTVLGERLAWSRAGLRRHRQAVQLVTQDPDDQLFSADVTADISFGPTNLALAPSTVRDRVEEALEMLALTDLRDRPTHELSYGQRKRVAMAGAFAMRPAVLALDEPTAGLDPAAVGETRAALARLHAAGTTLVLATHDVDLALSWADDLAVVVDGQVVQGAPAHLLGDTALVAAARLRTPWVLQIVQRLTAGQMLPPDAEPHDLAALLDLLDLLDARAGALRR